MLGTDTNGMNTRDTAAEAKSEYIRLQRDLNILPSGLTDLAGITEDDIDWLAEQTIEIQERLLRTNPRPIITDDVRDIFEDALHNW